MDEFIKESNINFGEIIQIDVGRMDKINHKNYDKFLSNTCNYIINILKEYNNKMDNNILNWKGVQKSKKNTNTFRQYFTIARNTFDRRKMTIMAKHLWTPIIKTIIEVYIDIHI